MNRNKIKGPQYIISQLIRIAEGKSQARYQAPYRLPRLPGVQVVELVSVPPRATPASTFSDPPSTHPCFPLTRTYDRHHSQTTSLLPDTQSLCYPCDTSDRRVGHANGIVAPLWKLCGRARLQFAPCQLYLRIGSYDDTTLSELDEM